MVTAMRFVLLKGQGKGDGVELSLQEYSTCKDTTRRLGCCILGVA
ncbi:hypothetical protein SLEP1_g30612 [Rubroshorea leprosula]|uniref:Uncharacterized protein n=1 Tax=Rubroshorea leprosula TaxID=152421 RepID=A0AAV5K6M7_9ROSI|nr:hypothetical protein SLEP1_g30612 [Rubroshorea leprosula]